MAEYFRLITPYEIEQSIGDVPALIVIQRRPVLVFMDTGSLHVTFTLIKPAEPVDGTAIHVLVYYWMTTNQVNSPTQKFVTFDVAFEQTIEDDGINLLTTTDFMDVDTGTDAVNSTAGIIGVVDITLDVEIEDALLDPYIRLQLSRVNGAADNATGDCHVVAVVVKTI